MSATVSASALLLCSTNSTKGEIDFTWFLTVDSRALRAKSGSSLLEAQQICLNMFKRFETTNLQACVRSQSMAGTA